MWCWPTSLSFKLAGAGVDGGVDLFYKLPADRCDAWGFIARPATDPCSCQRVKYSAPGGSTASLRAQPLCLILYLWCLHITGAFIRKPIQQVQWCWKLQKVLTVYQQCTSARRDCSRFLPKKSFNSWLMVSFHSLTACFRSFHSISITLRSALSHSNTLHFFYRQQHCLAVWSTFCWATVPSWILWHFPLESVCTAQNL